MLLEYPLREIAKTNKTIYLFLESSLGKVYFQVKLYMCAALLLGDVKKKKKKPRVINGTPGLSGYSFLLVDAYGQYCVGQFFFGLKI